MTEDVLIADAQKRIANAAVLSDYELIKAAQIIDDVLEAVREEAISALNKFGHFRSSHDGMSIVREEVDEMWDEVRKDDEKQAAKEAVQVAAMSVLFAMTFRTYNSRTPKEAK